MPPEHDGRRHQVEQVRLLEEGGRSGQVAPPVKRRALLYQDNGGDYDDVDGWDDAGSGNDDDVDDDDTYDAHDAATTMMMMAMMLTITRMITIKTPSDPCLLYTSDAADE